MGKEVEITLYHAEWCGHCVTFKPKFDKLKSNIEKMSNKYNDIPIKIQEFEHAELEKIGGGNINGEEIKGFPTIKIKLSSNKESKEYDYDKYGKSRDSKYMKNFIMNVCDGLAKLK